MSDSDELLRLSHENVTMKYLLRQISEKRSMVDMVLDFLRGLESMENSKWNVVLEDETLFNLSYEFAQVEAFRAAMAYDGWGGSDTEWENEKLICRHYYVFEQGEKKIIASIERM